MADTAPARQRITLQNLAFPEPGICTETELYYRAEGPVALDQSHNVFHLTPGARLIFDSYFNLFHLGKWAQYCDLDGLHLQLEGAGEAHLRLWQLREDQPRQLLEDHRIALQQDQVAELDLHRCLERPEGILVLELAAEDAPCSLTQARFQSHVRPEQTLPRLAVSITTFRREAEVRATVARLDSFLTVFPFRDQLRVQVVDNGQSAGIIDTAHITAFDNPNLGGAGGFARGLLEAEEAGCSHCLFMDDDAAFHMENIARSYAFLTLARAENAALAGAMINTTVPWALWENGAVFDGACRPLHVGTDLRDRQALLRMEYQSARDAAPTLYGGWWYFAFPIKAARHYPFPFFVRGDDISFSIANDFQIATLNGVVSFQEDFSEKESAQTLYLDLRNHLVHHLVFETLQRSALGTARIALRFMMRSMLRGHYDSAEAQLLAWQDVMQGPEFFDRHRDMAERRARLKPLSQAESWQPIDSVALQQRQRIFSRLPRRLRQGFGLVTLNGHLLPFWRQLGSHLVLPIGQRGLVYHSLGAARLTYLNGRGDKAYSTGHDKRRFFSLSWRMGRTLLRFLRRHRDLQRRYRAGYDDMTRRSYWQDILKRP